MKGKVESMGERRTVDAERDARLYAEAMAKDEPSAAARAFIREKFDADPAWQKERGDLLADAFDQAFKGFWLGYVTTEAVRREAEKLKQELGYADSSPVERVLIDHAVMCHVRLSMMEHVYSRMMRRAFAIPIPQGDHFERRLTMAQRRFTRAITTLERTRVLLARAEAFRAGSKLRVVGTKRAA
jgi:hypothetical protein